MRTEVGYEYSSDRSSIRMKLYAHMQFPLNSHSFIQHYVQCIAVWFAMSRYLVRGSSTKELYFFSSALNLHARLIQSRINLACLFWLLTCTIFDMLHNSIFC